MKIKFLFKINIFRLPLYLYTFIPLYLIITLPSFAQLNTGGLPIFYSIEGVPVETMPAFNVSAMLSEDSINTRNKIGYNQLHLPNYDSCPERSILGRLPKRMSSLRTKTLPAKKNL